MTSRITIFLMAAAVLLGVLPAGAAVLTCTSSGNWSNPAIWSGGAVPSAIDDITIRGGATVTIDMDASCQKIQLGGSGSSVDGGILIMPSTYYLLEVSGDIYVGSGFVGGTGILSMVNGGIVIHGTMDLRSNGTLLATGGFIQYAASGAQTAAAATYNVLTITTGTVTADGPITVKSDFSVSAGATFDCGGFSHTFGGDWANDGIFVAGTTTVDLNGDSPQSLSSASTFYNLTFHGTGLKTATGPLFVNHDFVVAVGATVSAGHYTHSVYRDWSISGTFNPNNSTVVLYGAGVQSIAGILHFNKLTLKGTGPKDLFSNITVDDTLSVEAGTAFHGNGFTHHFGGAFVLKGTFDVGAAAKTYFDGSGDQSIPADLILNDLILGGSNTKTALGSLVVNRDLTIQGSATFDAGSPAVVDTFKGKWTNDGSFLPHGGLVVFKSPSSQFISGATTFSDVTFQGAGTKFIDGSLTVNGNFTISPAATVVMDTSSATVKGDWTCNGSFDPGTATTTFNGGGNQSLTGTTTFNHLTLANGGVKTAANPLTVNGDLTLRNNTAFDGSVIFHGTSPQVVSGDFIFNDFTVQNDSGVRLSSTLGDTIHGVLHFTAGFLRLGSTDLTLQPAASITGAGLGKCIVTNGAGRVRRRMQGGISAETFTFPIAPSKSEYNPLLIQLRQDASEPTETFTVRVEELNSGSIGFGTLDSSRVVRRVWTIEEGTAGGNHANLAFQWDPADAGTNSGLNPADPVNLEALLYVPATGQYEHADDVVGPPYLNNPVVGVTIGFTTNSFGSYVLGNPAPLPITLASFTGSELPGVGVRLSWRTLSEIANFGFTVQRKSPTDSLWRELAGSFIPGNGTTAVPHDYAYTDSSARGGAWSYRLHQLDSNGGSYFSGAITVSVVTAVPEARKPLAFALEQNYPNPFNPSTLIGFSLDRGEEVSLRVYDILGREVAALVNGFHEAGTYSVEVNARGLASGVYVYRLATPTHAATKTFIVLK